MDRIYRWEGISVTWAVHSQGARALHVVVQLKMLQRSTHLKQLRSHHQRAARAQLSHSAQAQRHDLRARAIMHKAVDQLTQHRRQCIWRHQLMARLQYQPGSAQGVHAGTSECVAGTQCQGKASEDAQTSAIVHKAVHQLTQDWRQRIWRHQLMARLQQQRRPVSSDLRGWLDRMVLKCMFAVLGLAS